MEGDVASAALDLANEGPVQAGIVGEQLWGAAELLATVTDTAPKAMVAGERWRIRVGSTASVQRLMIQRLDRLLQMCAVKPSLDPDRARLITESEMVTSTTCVSGRCFSSPSRPVARHVHGFIGSAELTGATRASMAAKCRRSFASASFIRFSAAAGELESPRNPIVPRPTSTLLRSCR